MTLPGTHLPSDIFQMLRSETQDMFLPAQLHFEPSACVYQPSLLRKLSHPNEDSSRRLLVRPCPPPRPHASYDRSGCGLRHRTTSQMQRAPAGTPPSSPPCLGAQPARNV